MGKFKSVQTIDMNETEHGLIGIGSISYKYVTNNKNHLLTIIIHSIDKTISYEGERAKKIWKRVINDDYQETINLIKRLACEACGIPLIRIKEKTRKPEVVFARNMVCWYAIKFLNFSFHDAGSLFGKGSSNSVQGVRKYNSQTMIGNTQKALWKKVFTAKLIQYKLYS